MPEPVRIERDPGPGPQPQDQVIGRPIGPRLPFRPRPDIHEDIVAVDAAVLFMQVVGIEPDQLRGNGDRPAAGLGPRPVRVLPRRNGDLALGGGDVLMTEPEYFAGPAAGLVHQGEEEAVPQPGALVEDRLRLCDGQDPRQLPRGLQRDRPAAIGLVLADVVHSVRTRRVRSIRVRWGPAGSECGVRGAGGPVVSCFPPCWCDGSHSWPVLCGWRPAACRIAVIRCCRLVSSRPVTAFWRSTGTPLAREAASLRILCSLLLPGSWPRSSAETASGQQMAATGVPSVSPSKVSTKSSRKSERVSQYRWPISRLTAASLASRPAALARSASPTGLGFIVGSLPGCRGRTVDGHGEQRRGAWTAWRGVCSESVRKGRGWSAAGACAGRPVREAAEVAGAGPAEPGDLFVLGGQPGQ